MGQRWSSEWSAATSVVDDDTLQQLILMEDESW